MNAEEYITFIKHWTLALELAKDVADFTGEGECSVTMKMRSCTEDLRDSWARHTGSTEDFYLNNDSYLYDLVDFNGTASYFRYRLSHLAFIHGGKVLDLGCGIGTASFLLAEDNKVTGYDINQRLIDFCDFRRERYSLGGTFTTQMPDLREFDYIVAIDTLEHIEDLEGFIRMLGEETNEVMFYHYDCFDNQAISPMHFDHSPQIDNYLQDAGFEVLHSCFAKKTALNKICV